jgi:predicted aspartyl protease
VRRIAPITVHRRGAGRAVCLWVLLLAFPGQVVLSAADEPSTAPLAAASPATESEHDERLLFASPTTRDHIGRVIVPVTINGKGPFRFIVDTGANHSTISPALVQTLGLQPSAEASVLLNGITGSAQVTFVKVDRLQAGDMTIEATALPVVSADVMNGADGILGAAGFTTKSLMVDFQHNRVAISGSVAAAVRTEAMKVHALRLTHGLITLETRVGGVRVQAVIDTGSERTLGNLALRDALRMPGRRGALVQVTSVYGATEKIEAGEIRIAPTIVIESLRITDVAIVYGDFHIFKVWEMTDKPAMIIGMDVLGTVPVLGIDFERQDVYLAGTRGKGSESMSQVMHGYTGEQAMKK